MNLYKYIFSCAYWVSIHDLKEESAPQEYAFIYVSSVGVFLFVAVFSLINLIVGYNTLSATSVLISCGIIALTNYYIFLYHKKYEGFVKSFKNIGGTHGKSKRIKVLIITFVLISSLAVFLAFLNNYQSE